MCSVFSWKRRSQWNILAINMLSSQPRKCIYFFPYILCVAYLFAFAKYNIPLIQSTASKLLCGFCSTPGILQINCCTEFVLKKAFICFQTIHLAKWKESSSIFSQAVWSPLFAAVYLKEMRGTRARAELLPVLRELCLWPMLSAGQTEAPSSNTSTSPPSSSPSRRTHAARAARLGCS